MIAVKEEEVFVDLTVFDKNSQNVQFDCLMVMNCYIEEGMLELLTPLAKHVILVDGGANRLYKSSVRDAGNIMSIIGDIDSLEK
jgi:thiamine pyrophosphokinase